MWGGEGGKKTAWTKNILWGTRHQCGGMDLEVSFDAAETKRVGKFLANF